MKESAGKVREAGGASSNPVATPRARARRFRWWPPLLLLLIVLIGVRLRLGGLTWGVPSEPHYRNYYQDERFVLELLFHMDPARLDFDPHYYINPSLHYFTLLAALEAASLFGLKLDLPVKGSEPLRPENVPGGTYRALFLIGRLLVIVEGVLSVLLMYLIGRGLYNERTGLFAALLFAVNYPCMYQAHFITADGPALFWLILGWISWFGCSRSRRSGPAGSCAGRHRPRGRRQVSQSSARCSLSLRALLTRTECEVPSSIAARRAGCAAGGGCFPRDVALHAAIIPSIPAW